MPSLVSLALQTPISDIVKQLAHISASNVIGKAAKDGRERSAQPVLDPARSFQAPDNSALEVQVDQGRYRYPGRCLRLGRALQRQKVAPGPCGARQFVGAGAGRASRPVSGKRPSEGRLNTLAPLTR
jgi:hypothetical protein